MVTKKKVGRQPKKTSSAEVKPVGEVSTDVEVLPADADKEYFFESKYRDDCFTLIKPSKTEYKDGSVNVNPGVTAQFNQHGCVITNAHHAGLARQIMEDRPESGLSESATMVDHHASMARKAIESQRMKR